ncbi:outer membrane protein [Escherichia coli]|uniref:outer membrane protein n=1 Tax=Escherichia coli TaxID=562 RepID=UPI0010DA1A4F|nr:outer membrane beta-barrel protein [Escherichia coli]GDO95258.1 adhesin/virulence factor Hek [Escherichia coli]
MKKIITVSAMAMAGMFSTQTLADEGKTGFYVTGKAGASVVTQSDQRLDSTGYDNHTSTYKRGDNSDTVFGVGLAVGYDFYPHYNVPVRTEVEFYGRGNAVSEFNLTDDKTVNRSREDVRNKVSLNTLMVNAYYDFRNSSAFTPWVSAGLGYARINYKSTYIYSDYDNNARIVSDYTESGSKYDNNFAWSLGVGVKYDVTPDFSLDLSYRYLDAGDTTLSYKDGVDTYKSTVDVRNNEFMLGATYNF